MSLSMIVAKSTNNIIGRNNKLPWAIPEDLKFFKTLTMGKPIIMGRVTYDSIGRPLPGRKNIVLSRTLTQKSSPYPDEVLICQNEEEAIRVANAHNFVQGTSEIFVIGGEYLYRSMIDRSDKLYITQVHAEIEGDAIFPKVDDAIWLLDSATDCQAVEPNPFDYSFQLWVRR